MNNMNYGKRRAEVKRKIEKNQLRQAQNNYAKFLLQKRQQKQSYKDEVKRKYNDHKVRQIKFKDPNGLIHGGIMLPDGSVLCMCCGGIITDFNNAKSFELLKIYDKWIDVSDYIIEE